MSFYLVVSGVVVAATAFLLKKPCSNLVEKLRENATMYREIYKNTTWRNIYDLGIFKLRILAAQHLETGLISRRPGNGPAVYDLTYFDGPSKYVIRFTKTRGPCPFSHVTYVQENTNSAGKTYLVDKEVTETIRKFAGPSHNFYGIPTTPGLLDFPNLTFHYRNKTKSTFQKDDLISTGPTKTSVPDTPLDIHGNVSDFTVLHVVSSSE